MGVLGGILASAAGSFLGSWAGGVLAGLDGKMPQAPQLDKGELNKTYEYFRRAGQVQEDHFLKGLNFYKTSLEKAKGEIVQGYKQAELTLQPMAHAGLQSFNNLARMLGMNPVTNADLAAQKVGHIGADSRYRAFATKLELANSLDDPKKRLQAKNDLTQEFNNLLKNPYTEQLKKLGPKNALKGIYGVDTWDDLYNSLAGTTTRGSYDTLSQSRVAADKFGKVFAGGKPDLDIQKNREQFAKEVQASTIELMQSDWRRRPDVQEWEANYDKELAGIKKEQSIWEKDVGELESLFNEWKRNYKDKPEKGYKGAEQTEALRATPGYKVQTSQGTKGVNIAPGKKLDTKNLSSAVQEFGAKLADNYYGGYLNSLGANASANLPAQAQLAANALGQQNAIAGYTQKGGIAAMDTYQGIGDAWAEAYNKIGETAWDAEKFNTEMEFANYMMLMGRNDAAQLGAMNQASNLGYLGLANRKFNAQVQQNQNYGQGYLTNQNIASGKYYSGYGGLLFRNWGAL